MTEFMGEWVHYALRWLHLIAGISWIGNSFYFMWLDSHLAKPSAGKDPKKVEGELWMVHSGGFYQVEKRKIAPNEMPPVLHWFKWEATFTWLTGFGLLSLIFYANASIYLIDPAILALTPFQATAIGISLLAVGWLVYDLLWISPLAKGEKQLAIPATWISFILLIATLWGLGQVFSGRGLFIHIGALFGTLMVLNVWVRILPAQSQMIAATKRGETPDFELGKKAKKRSVHNSYMTLPVLFVMLSNHFPMTFETPHRLMVLAMLVLLGLAIRLWMIEGLKKVPWVILPLVVSLGTLFVLTKPKLAVSNAPQVSFSEVQGIFIKRCFECHSEHPKDAVFTTAPLGIKLDQPTLIQAYASRIKIRVVNQKTMPLNNQTQMTEAERTLIGAWVDGGANVP